MAMSCSPSNEIKKVFIIEQNWRYIRILWLYCCEITKMHFHYFYCYQTIQNSNRIPLLEAIKSYDRGFRPERKIMLRPDPRWRQFWGWKQYSTPVKGLLDSSTCCATKCNRRIVCSCNMTEDTPRQKQRLGTERTSSEYKTIMKAQSVL